jgi:hypothetical protein
MEKIKSLFPLWLLNVGVVTATSMGETLNFIEQILKIGLLLLTTYFTYRIGKKKLAEKKEKDTDTKPL